MPPINTLFIPRKPSKLWLTLGIGFMLAAPLILSLCLFFPPSLPFLFVFTMGATALSASTLVAGLCLTGTYILHKVKRANFLEKHHFTEASWQEACLIKKDKQTFRKALTEEIAAFLRKENITFISKSGLLAESKNPYYDAGSIKAGIYDSIERYENTYPSFNLLDYKNDTATIIKKTADELIVLKKQYSFRPNLLEFNEHDNTSPKKITSNISHLKKTNSSFSILDSSNHHANRAIKRTSSDTAAVLRNQYSLTSEESFSDLHLNFLIFPTLHSLPILKTANSPSTIEAPGAMNKRNITSWGKKDRFSDSITSRKQTAINEKSPPSIFYK